MALSSLSRRINRSSMRLICSASYFVGSRVIVSVCGVVQLTMLPSLARPVRAECAYERWKPCWEKQLNRPTRGGGHSEVGGWLGGGSSECD